MFSSVWSSVMIMTTFGRRSADAVARWPDDPPAVAAIAAIAAVARMDVPIAVFRTALPPTPSHARRCGSAFLLPFPVANEEAARPPPPCRDRRPRGAARPARLRARGAASPTPASTTRSPRGERPAAPALRCRRSTGSGRGSLADYRGKVVVLNFWASWCEPCRTESPLLERWHRRLAARGGTVLGVDVLDVSSDARDVHPRVPAHAIPHAARPRRRARRATSASSATRRRS